MLNIIIFLLLLERLYGFPNPPIVSTKIGMIRGVKATNGEYSKYLGIPYALVNMTNPFGPSLPHPKFETVFEADKDGTICPQLESHTNEIEGALDCLNLNIYVPNNKTTKLPVMVYIYGGAFVRGIILEKYYGAKYLVRHDVILVTISYRVGPYGFMCLDVPGVPGNQGFKDQLAALRWIRDNMEAFGGDNNKVTVFGQSVGGRSIDLHILSPHEKLFNNAILESGTSLIRGSVIEPDTTVPVKLSTKLGFPTDNTIEALSFLSKVEPKSVIEAVSGTDITFAGCKELDFQNEDKFITDYPVNLKPLKARTIPILLGYNSDEQVAVYATKNSELAKNFLVIRDRLKEYFDFDVNRLSDMDEIIRHFYIGDESVSNASLYKIIDFDSDFTYSYPVEMVVPKYLNVKVPKLFKYVFSYVGNRNLYKNTYNVTVGGASHFDELGYLFHLDTYGKPTSEDQLMIDRMTTLWTNFAKFSDPTPSTSTILPVKWEPITTQSPYYYLNINTDMSLEKRPFHDRMAFWDLFFKLNAPFQKGYKNKYTF